MDKERADRDIANARRELLAMENMLRAMRGEAPLQSLPEQMRCGFCARSEAEVGMLAEGIGVCICEPCADAALRKLRDKGG